MKRCHEKPGEWNDEGEKAREGDDQCCLPRSFFTAGTSHLYNGVQKLHKNLLIDIDIYIDIF